MAGWNMSVFDAKPPASLSSAWTGFSVLRTDGGGNHHDNNEQGEALACMVARQAHPAGRRMGWADIFYGEVFYGGEATEDKDDRDEAATGHSCSTLSSMERNTARGGFIGPVKRLLRSRLTYP
jgi:hypothetical protein